MTPDTLSRRDKSSRVLDCRLQAIFADHPSVRPTAQGLIQRATEALITPANVLKAGPRTHGQSRSS